MRKKFLFFSICSVLLALIAAGTGLSLTAGPLFAVSPSGKGTVVRLPSNAYEVPEPFVYEVAPGDNLHWLAAKFYGNARQWDRIHNANRERLPEPNKLGIGQKLLIPANLPPP